MFKIGDKVKVDYDGEQQFGEIEKINTKSVRVFLYDEYDSLCIYEISFNFREPSIATA